VTVGPPEPDGHQATGEQSVDDYIAANRDRFTPGALRDSLRAAGHSADAVEAALARAFASRTASSSGGNAAPVVPATPVGSAAPPARSGAPAGAFAPQPARSIREAMSGSQYGTRGRIAVLVLRVAYVAMFLAVAWWYVGSMSGVGAIIAGILLAFGLGVGFLLSMTALGESSARLRRGNVVLGVAAGVVTPLLVMIVLTGVCVGVSLPIDWLTGGI
jgi:hypothetical protein